MARAQITPVNYCPSSKLGWAVGKYLVYRLYKEEGLALKRVNHTETYCVICSGVTSVSGPNAH